MTWLLENYGKLFEIFGTVVTAATMVVTAMGAIMPQATWDNWMLKKLAWLADKLSIFTPDSLGARAVFKVLPDGDSAELKKIGGV